MMTYCPVDMNLAVTYWRFWSYDMLARDVLTLAEVLERLELEVLVLRSMS